MFKSAVFNLQEASKDQVQEFLDSFDTVLTDCDGKTYSPYMLLYLFCFFLNNINLLTSFWFCLKHIRYLLLMFRPVKTASPLPS